MGVKKQREQYRGELSIVKHSQSLTIWCYVLQWHWMESNTSHLFSGISQIYVAGNKKQDLNPVLL